MESSAIVFVHKGNPCYLKYALNNAKKSNPNSDIILIGDESNKNTIARLGGRHYRIADYFFAAKEFEKIYIYQSTNSYDFELFCFQRWFIIKDFVESNDIKHFIACDSDVLIYDDLSNYFNYSEWKSDYLNVIDRWGPQCVYFTKESVVNFCNYIKNEYTNREKLKRMKQNWQNNLQNNLPGGISDMTVFSNYGIDFPEKFKNLYGVTKCKENGCLFYDAANYELFNKVLFKHKIVRHMTIAKIQFSNHIPFVLGNDGMCYKCPIIHFQGPYKGLMCKYSYESFFVKLYDVLKFYFIALVRKLKKMCLHNCN